MRRELCVVNDHVWGETENPGEAHAEVFLKFTSCAFPYGKVVHMRSERL